MNCMTIGLLIGLGFALFVTFIIFLQGYKPQICINTLVAVGITSCLLCGLLGSGIDADEEIDNTIKATINANYDNVVNYHNNIRQQSFVSDGAKYTFDYDDETKTLTVFTDTNANVDAVFIDSVKQNNQKTSDKADKKKDCVSYKTNDKVDTDNESSTTAAVTDTDLQQKIKDKIQSKYNGAVMTSFDTINLSGTFSCDNIQYNFVYKDNMLEVSNINDINDVTYYKISN
jgi:hypothetical protein